ncbi:tumor suppressor candidate gene 1 protein [Varanus komodoensis]|uniref:tumor suppressor candidate gene 1 protein n=1 Tax=Varanus komodoensis TaxID=61221 RepID=UPI001CF7C3BB|nr:tumor suppressor candidate gene 1 protein [Varanus komodoensis]
MRRMRGASRQWRGCCFCGARAGSSRSSPCGRSARRGRSVEGECCVCGGWRGRPGGSPEQLAERYADLAASHAEALRLGEERERQSRRLREENARLKLENRRLRRENRNLFRQALKLPQQQELLRDPEAEAGREAAFQEEREAQRGTKRARVGEGGRGDAEEDAEEEEAVPDLA